MSQEFLSLINSNSTNILIGVSGILVSLLIIYIASRKYDKNIYYYFDRYFLTLLGGILLSRFIWICINYKTLLNLEWTLLPYIRYQDYISGIVTYSWFVSLPWKILELWNWNNYFLGILVFYILSSYLISRKNIEKGYYSAVIIGYSMIPTAIAIIAILEININYISRYSFRLNLQNAILGGLIIFSIYLLNLIILNKKASDMKIMQSTRTEQHDMVKEVANWTRLNKFKITSKRGVDSSVNNPSIPR
jgi:hypothetical protein